MAVDSRDEGKAEFTRGGINRTAEVRRWIPLGEIISFHSEELGPDDSDCLRKMASDQQVVDAQKCGGAGRQ